MHRLVNTSDNSVVEQASGALMLHYGIGSRESRAVLERWAQEAGLPVTEVAEALVHGICLGRVTAETEGTVRWLEQRLRGDIGDVRRAAEQAREQAMEQSTEGLAQGEGAVVPPVPAPADPPAVPRQWRYHSAVHAARVLRSR
jgi:hypothetical protein